MQLIKGKLSTKKKIIVYGADGIGKSTFASQSPNPIFMTTENGTSHLDVTRLPEVTTWPMALEQLKWTPKCQFETLVIDSLDWLESVLFSHVALANAKSHIDDIAYGKGYKLALSEWQKFIASLPTHMDVIAVAHQATVKMVTPEGDAYDTIGIKMHEKTSALWREWADYVLYATRPIKTIQKEKSSRKIGKSDGERVLRTQWSAAWQAKSRTVLPDEIPMDYSEFQAYLTVTPEGIIAKIEEALDGHTQDIQARVRKAMEGANLAKLTAILAKLVDDD